MSNVVNFSNRNAEAIANGRELAIDAYMSIKNEGMSNTCATINAVNLLFDDFEKAPESIKRVELAAFIEELLDFVAGR